MKLQWQNRLFNTQIFEVNKGEKESMPEDENKVLETLEVLTQFKQIILFGPPGTGKTFSAMEE